MRSASLATLVAFSVLVPATAFGQFSITNYQFVSEQRVTLTSSAVTYRADLVNTGGAAAGVTATVSSLDPFTVRIIPGQETLQFAPVPANSQVTSNNTFTILVDRTQPFNFNKLSWTFVINTQPPPVANAGPNQTVPVGTTVTLDGTRSTNPSGIGTLTYSFAFTSLPPGSRTLLQRSTTPNPMFLVDVPGTYVVLLTVSNGVDSSTSSVTVSTSCTTPPVAVAGPDQTVAPGATVVLNGSASTSPCGSPLTYAYTLISRPAGSTATLTGANTVSPSFVADKPGVYKAQLIVNDGVNNSAPSIVTITQLVKPVANITAAPPVVNVGAPVQLSGAGSTDANGLPLTYQFSFLSVPAGSGATLSNPNIVNPTFTADRQGTYVVQLIVNNGTLSSDPVTIAITPSIGPAPTANAGPNQSAFVGSTVTLNGSGTDPQNLPLTYQFSLINKPAGSAAALSNPSIPNPTFVADLPGTYIAQLIVNNGVQSSAPSTVTISTTCFQPTANAGPNQNVGVGATVTLNGSGSGDVCHDPLTYAFSFTTRPPGSNATLSGANTATPTFVTDVAGMYVVQLIVNNGVTNSTPSTVTITAANDIILPAGVRVVVGQTADFPVTLTNPAGSGGVFLSLISSDPSKVAISPTSIFIPQGATAPSRVPTVTGIGNGSAIITASGTGLSSASQTVTVGNGPTINFLGSPLGLIVGASGNLTLTQSGSDPLTVTLSSSNPAAATVPATVSFGPGQSSVPVPVTSVGAGSTTINASAPGTSAAATVNVTQLTINVASASIALGQTTPLAVSLSGPAVTAVTINLASSDASKVTVSPATVSIAAGATTPVTQPTVTGTGIGSATITGSAPNYTSGSGTVTVTAPTLNFTGSPLSVTVGNTGSLTINLAGGTAPAGGFVVNLVSSDPNTATVPATVTIPAGTNSTAVPVTGVVGGGPVTITASAPGIATNATASVTVVSLGITVTPTSVNLGASVSLPVTLSQAAPVGGVTVTLTSSDPSKVTVSPSVFIAAGATTPATLPQVTGAGIGSATITASAPGYSSGNGAVTVTAPTLNFTGSPLSVTINTPGTLTINLAGGQAPAGGFVVNLVSSDPTKATVPASVTIPAGATSAAVTVTGVAQGGPVTITASAPGIAANATASVTVATLVINVPAPLNLNLGASTVFTISLSQAAPAGGVTVGLVSSDPTKVTVSPASVFIAAGATTPDTQPQVTGAGFGSATITASAPGYTSGAGSVTVNPPALNFTGSPLALTVGASGNLTLNLATALGSDLTVTLTSGNPAAATVPASVIIPAGSTSVPVPVSGVATGSATITASVPNTTANATATVNVTQIAISIASVPVSLGGTATLNVTLSGPAPTAVTINLNNSDPSKVTLSAPSVSIAAGATAPAAQPSVTGIGIGTATITGTAANFASGNGIVTVTPPTLTFAPTSLTIIQTNTGTLTLNLGGGQAPAGGFTVNLTSSDPTKATVPATATFAPGATSASVTVTGVAAGQTTITASAPGIATAATAAITVIPQPSITVTGLSLNLGQTQSLSVALSAPAPTGGVTVALSSSDASKVSISAASVFIAAGATAPATPPTVTGVGNGSAGITATAPGFTTGTGTVVVNPPTLNFTESTFSIQQGSIGNVTLNLRGGVAPPGGFTVALSSNDPTKATVPATVTFAGGAASVLVPITGLAVTNQVTITASGPNIPTTSISGAITTPPPPRTISVGSTSLGQNLQAPILLAVSPVAPGGGVDLTVTSSDPSKVLLAINPTDAGTASVVVTVAQGLTLQRVYVQGLASSGTVTITATGSSYQSGQGIVTLTPSGFIIASPGDFTTSVGALSPTVLTLNAVRLDSSLNFAEVQQVRGGFSTQVTVSSSNPNVGTASPVVFAGGVDTATSAFNPTTNNANAGSTLLTVQAPFGFSTPTARTSVTATVNQSMIVCQTVTVGNKLQNTVSCSLQGGSPTAGLQVTFSSNDPSKLQFAALPVGASSCTDPGSSTLTVTVVKPALGSPVIPFFCVYGLANSGSVNYSIAANGFIPGTGTVALGPGGIVISGPGGVGGASFVAFNADTAISVFSALLDQSGNYVAAQPIAGGSSATVDVTSSNTSIGTITTSPLTIPAGSTGATTNFHRGTGVSGATNLTVSVAPGFSSPALQYTRVTANVLLQKFSLSCSSPLGKDLQETCSVSVSFQAPSALTVTISSSNPALVALANTATTAGSGIINVTIAAGGTSATFFAQGLDSAGSSNLLASSPGSGIADSDLLPVTLAPSGAVFSGLPFLFTNVGAPPTAVTVALSVLNPDGSSTSNFQALRGGLAPVQITLNSSNPGVGTITSPISISAGNSSANAQFTPVSAGTTTISVLPAPGFSAASTKTSFPASVSP